MKRSTIRKSLDVSILVPMVPNFVEVNGLSTPISHLADEHLIDLATRWKLDLLENAHRMRQAEEAESIAGRLNPSRSQPKGTP